MRDRLLAAAYVLWAVIAVGLAFAAGGLSRDNVTRIAIIGWFGLQLATWRWLRGVLVRGTPGARFVVVGMVLAAVVEGCYMISRPVFPGLVVDRGMDAQTIVAHYALDLALTLPAYLVIFTVIWRFVRAYRYSLWEYVLIAGAGQALGDGFVYFVSAPAMLLFLPYPMLNYHAINVVPFLAVRDELPATFRVSHRRFLLLPVLVIVYLSCGAVISAVGSWARLN